MKELVIVSYDVREERRLRRVARILEGYGHRVQYSVFVCRVTQRELERLRWELTRVLEDEDDLLVVGLCAACADKLRHRSPREWLEETPACVVL